MKTRITLFLAVALQASAVSLMAQDSAQAFSLQQAVEYALEHNRTLQNATADRTIAQKKIRETTSTGLPQVNADITYQHFIDIPTSVAPAEAFGGPAGEFAELKFGTKHNATAGISLSQLIFSGPYIVGLQAARTYARMSQESHARSEGAVRDEVASAYCAALAAALQRDMLAGSRDVALRALEETRALQAAGFAEQLDVELFELQLSQVENALTSAASSAAVALDALKLQMGFPVSGAIRLTDNLDELVARMDTGTAAAGFEVANHIEHKLMVTQEALARLNVRREQFTRLPSVAAFLNHSQNAYRNSFDLFDNSKWYPATIVGVKIQIPLFDSFGQSARIGQARLEQQKLAAIRELTAERLTLERNAAEAGYRAALAGYRAAQRNVALSGKILERTRTKHREGLASSFELTQMQNQHIAVRMAGYRAALDLLNARIRLNRILSQ